MTLEAQAISLPPPEPVDIATSSLLLDFDGTLVALADVPDEVVVPAALLDLLARLSERMEGRVAIISGRSLAQLDALLGPVAQSIALSGSHGCEHRWSGVDAAPVRPRALDAIAERFRAFAAPHPEMAVEEKSFGVALHYRRVPALAEAAEALARMLAEETGLAYQPGRALAEIRVPGSDKGVAVARLMQRAPMSGTRPIMIGDDETDESAFIAALDLGGVAIAVGERPSANARHHLPDPEAVCAWLWEMAA
jgi:trehalose 6-phosphate phosphatase